MPGTQQVLSEGCPLSMWYGFFKRGQGKQKGVSKRKLCPPQRLPNDWFKTTCSLQVEITSEEKRWQGRFTCSERGHGLRARGGRQPRTSKEQGWLFPSYYCRERTKINKQPVPVCGVRKGACAQPKESKGRERGITGKNGKARARAGYATPDPENLTMEKSVSNLQSWEHLWFQPSETLENKSLEIWVIRAKKMFKQTGGGTAKGHPAQRTHKPEQKSYVTSSLGASVLLGGDGSKHGVI